MTEPIQDNIYPIGTRISARENPTRELIIHSYYQRIYYCALADDPTHKHLVYFEKDLISAEENGQNT